MRDPLECVEKGDDQHGGGAAGKRLSLGIKACLLSNLPFLGLVLAGYLCFDHAVTTEDRIQERRYGEALLRGLVVSLGADLRSGNEVGPSLDAVMDRDPEVLALVVTGLDGRILGVRRRPQRDVETLELTEELRDREGSQGRLQVVMDLDRIRVHRQSRLIGLIGFLGSGLLLLVLMARSVRRWLRRRLGQLQAMLARAREGDFRPVELDCGDELGALGDELRQLLGIVARRLDDQQASRDEAIKQARTAWSEATSHLDLMQRLTLVLESPMDSLLGYSQALGELVDDPRAQEALQSIARNAEAVRDLIAGAQDFARIESGRLEHDPQPVEMRSFCDEVQAAWGPRLEAAGLHLDLRVSPQLPSFLDLDAEHLRRSLDTCLERAEQVAAGRVGVFVQPGETGGGAGARSLVIDVEDQGPGMSRREIRAMFEPLGGRDQCTDPRRRCLNLQLAVTQRRVRRLGGALEVIHSSSEAGTQLRLQLPSGPCAGRSAPVQGRLVLILHESGESRPAAAALLRRIGARVEGCSDEAAVLRRCLHQREAGPVDLLLVDAGSRFRDSQLGKTLREGGYGGQILCVLPPGDCEGPVPAGCDAVLSAPLNMIELGEVMDEVLAAAPQI